MNKTKYVSLNTIWEATQRTTLIATCDTTQLTTRLAAWDTTLRTTMDTTRNAIRDVTGFVTKEIE